MVLPAIIAAATLAYSTVFPDGHLPGSSPGSSRGVVVRANASPFFYGFVIGVFFSSWTTYELKRQRLLEKLRLSFFSWLYDNDEAESEKLRDKFRKPVKIDEVAGEPMHGSEVETGGVRRDLLSPDWALTSNMVVSTLTLPLGTELVAKEAGGLEFYYVIKGEGDYIGKDKTKIPIKGGSTFIVDPGSERGFTAWGRKDLVLLRAIDCVSRDGEEVSNQLQASSLSSTSALVSAGLNKLQNMVKSYKAKQESKSASDVE